MSGPRTVAFLSRLNSPKIHTPVRKQLNSCNPFVSVWLPGGSSCHLCHKDFSCELADRGRFNPPRLILSGPCPDRYRQSREDKSGCLPISSVVSHEKKACFKSSRRLWTPLMIHCITMLKMKGKVCTKLISAQWSYLSSIFVFLSFFLLYPLRYCRTRMWAVGPPVAQTPCEKRLI